MVKQTPGQEGPFYPFDKDGKFLGCFVGFDVELPVETMGCAPVAPEHSDDTWSGSEWVSSPEYIRSKAKVARTEAVGSIVVTTRAGNSFDGYESAQDRMARAIVGMQNDSDTATIQWVLADNSVAQVTRSELIEALRLAGEKQTELWVI